MTFYGCALVSHFERLGIYSLNNALAINRVHDRFAALQLLLDKGIAIPASGLASAALDTGDVIKMIGGAPLIIKPLDGASERSVIHVESRKAAENVIDAYKAVHANLLVQACVREAQGRSLRCVVADGKVVAAIERDINSADHAGEQSIAMRKSALSVEERKLARKAVHATGLRVAGVDLLRTAQGPLLLEVVASPALEEIETVTSRDVAAAMIGVVEKKLGWRQSSSE